MSSTQLNAGQMHGEAQAKTEEWIDSAKSTANEAQDKASHAIEKTHEKAEQTKDESASFLQQTGEKVTTIASDTIDTVKSTLGIGEKK